MPDDDFPSQTDGREPTDGAVEREFREALRRLGLSVDAEDFDLALAGYRHVKREIEIVRRHLSTPRPAADRPGISMVGKRPA